MTDTTTDEALAQLIGTPTAKATVVVERGPVTFFAAAVLEKSPIYHDPRARPRPACQHPGAAHVPHRHGVLGQVPRDPALRRPAGRPAWPQ